jgi:hypothetical protein
MGAAFIVCGHYDGAFFDKTHGPRCFFAINWDSGCTGNISDSFVGRCFYKKGESTQLGE